MHVKASCSSSCMWIGGMNMPWLYKVLVYYVCEKSRYLCYGSNFKKIPNRTTGSFKISCFKVSTLCSISLWLILILTSAGGFISRMIYVNFDFPADLASRNVLWVWMAYWVSPIWGFTSVKIQILDGKLREKLKAEYLHNFVSRRTLTC